MLRPMLAGKAPADLDKLTLPTLASAKLDGFRCLIVTPSWYSANVGPNTYADRADHAMAVTRSLKPLQNIATQKLLDRPELVGLDGELLVGDATHADVFKKTTSALRKVAGEPDVQLHVFDNWQSGDGFQDRVAGIKRMDMPDFAAPVEQVRISSIAELEALEQQFLADGYEGLIIRSIGGLYKFGRSTVGEGGMLKLKRFTDAEAVIVGFEERLHNTNEKKVNELGYSSRSSHKKGKVGMGMLGAFVCVNAAGVQFNVGTGMTEAERILLWRQREKLMGRILKYKSFLIGAQDAPRHPVFLGFRAEEDL